MDEELTVSEAENNPQNKKARLDPELIDKTEKIFIAHLINRGILTPSNEAYESLSAIIEGENLEELDTVDPDKVDVIDVIATLNYILALKSEEKSSSSDLSDVTREDDISLLPLIKNPLMKTFYSPDTLLSKTLFEGCLLDGSKRTLEVNPHGKKKVEMSFSALIDQKTVVASNSLTAFDRLVLDAVYSIYIEAENQNDPAMFNERHIHQIISGQQFVRDIDEVTVERIRGSINKMRLTSITIDASEQYSAWKLGEYVPADYEGYLLPVERIGVRTRNGEKENAYRIIFPPVLLRYSKAVRQIVSYPFNTLQPHKVSAKGKQGTALKSTPKNQILNHYLQRRISVIKNKAEKKNIRPSDYVIRYSEIYKQVTGDESLSKQERARVRETVVVLLDSMKHNKLIKGYEIVYRGESSGLKGNTPESLKIIL